MHTVRQMMARKNKIMQCMEHRMGWDMISFHALAEEIAPRIGQQGHVNEIAQRDDKNRNCLTRVNAFVSFVCSLFCM